MGTGDAKELARGDVCEDEAGQRQIGYFTTSFNSASKIL
jgi:hypothetical protein